MIKNKKPGAGRLPGATSKSDSIKYTACQKREQHWRNQIADPGALYRELYSKAKPNREGWVLVHCPFHADKKPSLSINFDHGGWRCFANCGSGDLVAFIQRYYKVSFKAALAKLGVRL